MVYKPRNIDRVPFMARLRKMMHTVMEEVALVQLQGEASQFLIQVNCAIIYPPGKSYVRHK